MFSRLAARLPKASSATGAGLSAAKPSFALSQARYASRKAFAGGSRGRDMPAQKYRTPTSPDAQRAAEATLTLRVRAPRSLAHPLPMANERPVAGWSRLPRQAFRRERQHLR